MTFKKSALLATLAVPGVAALMASPAGAQKSKDTIRLAINNPFIVLSPYHNPLDEAGNFFRVTHESLIAIDEHKQKIVPQLAKAWRRINPTTLEFDLRDDVKFHNGNAFNADDVVATINYIKDPKVKLRFKGRFSWVKEVQKLGPYKVRIIAKKPNATDLTTIAYRFKMLDGETQNSLVNKADYGRLTPVGTGPYKVVQLDRTKGIIVERVDGYNVNPAYGRAPVKRIHGIPIPDRQTQIAQILTGGIDMIRNVPPDAAKRLKAAGKAEVTALNSGAFIFLGLDAVGRGPNKILKDVRVRRAIYKAINRDELIKHIVPGGEVAEKLKGLCFDFNVGCKFDNSFPGYDPEGAKKLLAEAGYPNGFDLHYDVYSPIKEVGQAIAGELRKVGIRTTVQTVTLGTFRSKQGQSKVEAWSVFLPTSSHPDVGNVLNVFFSGRRDYAKDPVIAEAMRLGRSEFDPDKRAAIYQKALERNNEMHYMLAVSSLPTVYAHSKDIRIGRGLLSAREAHISDYFWK